METIKQCTLCVLLWLLLSSIAIAENTTTEKYTTAEAQKIYDLLKKTNQPDQSKVTKSRQSQDIWFSKNPEDLKPLTGTMWTFWYTTNDLFYDTITFTSNIETMNDGAVGLWCHDENNTQGMVFYRELLAADEMTQGYSMLFFIGDITATYTFIPCHSKLACNYAVGDLMIADQDSGAMAGPYSFHLGSRCIDGCDTVCCERGDVDGDGKTNLNDAIHALQITAGIGR